MTTVDQSKPYAITGAPRIAKGRVLIGNAGAEFGVRGYVSAYDAETGKLAWRFYTVPGDPKHGFESKALEGRGEDVDGEWWKTGGGGTAWDAIVYDPELDLVYFGTGNGTPWYRDLRSPGGGDNLYRRLDRRRATAEHRRIRLALSGHARRQLGLRRHAAADARGPDDRRTRRARSSCRRRRTDSSTCSIARRASSSRRRRSSAASRGPRDVDSVSGRPVGITDGLRRTEAGARFAGRRRRAQLAADGVRCLEGARLPRRAERNATRPCAERRVGLGLERPKHG